MRGFDALSFDQDVLDRDGFPAGAEEFRSRLERCDCFVIAAPEYSASLPGLLKNAVDWVSRYRRQRFNEKYGLLLSASPSMVGGNRGLWALRVPFEHLGARIYPDMFSLVRAHTAFTDEGRNRRPAAPGTLRHQHVNLMNSVEAFKHYSCAKRGWSSTLASTQSQRSIASSEGFARQRRWSWVGETSSPALFRPAIRVTEMRPLRQASPPAGGRARSRASTSAQPRRDTANVPTRRRKVEAMVAARDGRKFKIACEAVRPSLCRRALTRAIPSSPRRRRGRRQR